MSGIERFLESLAALIRRIVRDLLCPAAGLFLVYKLGLGQFATGAVPFIATLASTLIGLPVWLKSDERRRKNSGGDDDGDGPGGDEPPSHRKSGKRFTIEFGRGDDDEPPSK